LSNYQLLKKVYIPWAWFRYLLFKRNHISERNRTFWGPTEPPTQWTPQGFFPWGKEAGAWSWPFTSI